MPAGIASDLARELARRLNLAIDFVTYDAAGKMADGAKNQEWDVAFLAADPARSNEIAFTSPYLEIETTYLVSADSTMKTVDDADREGVRIVVSNKSAYDLFLTRSVKRAQLVRAPGPEASVELFFKDNLDALAGIRPMLMDVARSRPGYRLLEGSFTSVRQAIGVPRGRDAAARYLEQFVQEVKNTGFVDEVVRKNERET
jgi:polar amino acid transport system substrate-binding protein